MEARETEVDAQRRRKGNGVEVWPHRQPYRGALGHAGGAVICRTLVVRVAIAESKGGCGTGFDDNKSRRHGGENLASLVMSYFCLLALVRRGRKVELWIALEAARCLANIAKDEGDSLIPSSGVGAVSIVSRHRELTR